MTRIITSTVPQPRLFGFSPMPELLSSRSHKVNVVHMPIYKAPDCAAYLAISPHPR